MFTRILLGACDLLAVLDTIPARAEDAGQEAVEPEDGVPHFPMGVGLPIVNTSWGRERKELLVEINPPPLCKPKALWSHCLSAPQTWVVLLSGGMRSSGSRSHSSGHRDITDITSRTCYGTQGARRWLCWV